SGLGAARWRRRLRGAAAFNPAPGGLARAPAHRPPGFHVSCAEGRALRSVARPAGVRRAVGGRARAARGAESGERCPPARELAGGAVSVCRDETRAVRIVSPRRTLGAAPRSPLPLSHGGLLVGALA